VNEVTRTEFDGLGGRVTTLREEFVTFKAAKEVVLTSLAEAIEHQAQNDTRLFEAQDSIRTEISSSFLLFLFRNHFIGGE
jgi:hypothetical protein